MQPIECPDHLFCLSTSAPPDTVASPNRTTPPATVTPSAADPHSGPRFAMLAGLIAEAMRRSAAVADVRYASVTQPDAMSARSAHD